MHLWAVQSVWTRDMGRPYSVNSTGLAQCMINVSNTIHVYFKPVQAKYVCDHLTNSRVYEYLPSYNNTLLRLITELLAFETPHFNRSNLIRQTP